MADDNYFKSVSALIKAALSEDVGPGDLTSLACLDPNNLKATVTAKSSGILSGIKPALMTFDIVDSANIIRSLKNDGDKFEPGDIILDIEGFNQTVLTSERIALNFLGRLSGIATFTSKFVEQIKGTECQILDTRKTTPGWRLLEKEAVVYGGGKNHRYGLYDMILIKDNHIASTGSIKNAVEFTREYLTTPDFRLQFDCKAEDIEIEVEVSTKKQMKEAIEVGIKRLLLDNQSTEQLKRLVEIARGLNPELVLEASGNVTLENVAEVASTGVDYISIGAITHSAISSDFSLNLIEQ
jgi:nicotinate-nucleotide pyrophosphorylase (carboxylating)